MSIQILPLLIREKIDYYLYFRVWRNRIRAVNLEYDGSLLKGDNKLYDRWYPINLSGIEVRIGGLWRCFNFRYLCFDNDDPSFRRVPEMWSHIHDIREKNVCELPKHYQHVKLEEIL